MFQNGKGSVRLATTNRLSGYHSVELRDVRGDGHFPELQGYFPMKSAGKLFLHFGLMTTDPMEELNIALAGPEWFTLRKDGIGFWLKVRDGHLHQISDSIPKRLLAIKPFTWYVADVAYDVSAGTYDLTLREEGSREPVLSLREQTNAPNQAGSRVDKFSFIGDHDTDESGVLYYVDDVLVGVDEKIIQTPFLAPGRKKLFVDYWLETQQRRSGPQPLPLIQLEDLGIGHPEADQLKRDGLGDAVRAFIAGNARVVPSGASPKSRAILESIAAWREASGLLTGADVAKGLEHLERAIRLSPSAPLFKMDAVVALARLGQWDAVDRRLAEIVPAWRDDPRLPVALAMIGLARGDLESFERIVRDSSGAMHHVWAEQYFFALLWKGEITRAEQFANSMHERSRATARVLWSERLGDVALLMGAFDRARETYERSLDGHPSPSSVWLKLSDVHFKLGDLEREREFRERLFGHLRP